MAILREILIGAGMVILDSFGGPPIAQVTVTLPADNALADDFGRVSGDLAHAIEKVKNADQLELSF
jgi:hypothetical protein